ncbi:MAG: MTH1187 family thiamine-binding protein [Anaerolineales bacterium]
MGHTINLAIQVIPKSLKHDQYSLVDAAIEAIQQTGLKYEVCPFETVIEGEYGETMKAVKNAWTACFKAGAEEVLVNLKFQIRKGGDVTIEAKTGKYR